MVMGVGVAVAVGRFVAVERGVRVKVGVGTGVLGVTGSTVMPTVGVGEVLPDGSVAVGLGVGRFGSGVPSVIPMRRMSSPPRPSARYTWPSRSLAASALPPMPYSRRSCGCPGSETS
jgi:hypothetical protein